MAILKYPAVIAETGLSASTVRRLVERGEFPPPLKLSQRAVGWTAESIQQFIQERAAKVAA